MMQTLFDRSGARKYLVARERLSFVDVAVAEGGVVGSFCLTLAFTGARISEVLALTTNCVDAPNGALIFETLKRRKRGVFRAVPVPEGLISILTHPVRPPGHRLWPWGRTTSWTIVKRVMRTAGIADNLCMPKALRHAFAIDAGQNSVPLSIVQRWLGHARIETTAIYADALGEEERALARRCWCTLEGRLPK